MRDFWLIRDECGDYRVQRTKPTRRIDPHWWKTPIDSEDFCSRHFERQVAMSLPVDLVDGVENEAVKVRLEEYTGRGKCFVAVNVENEGVEIRTKKGVMLLDFLDPKNFRLISGCRLKKGVPKTLRMVRVKD